MSDGELEEVRDFWNRIADDWRIQVGDDGDSNRILNSDSVLWKFAGAVSGRRAVLRSGGGVWVQQASLQSGQTSTAHPEPDRCASLPPAR